MNLSKEQSEAFFNEFNESCAGIETYSAFEKLKWTIEWIPAFYNRIFKMGFEAGKREGRLRGIKEAQAVHELEMKNLTTKN